jgi:hypothetical protein
MNGEVSLAVAVEIEGPQRDGAGDWILEDASADRVASITDQARASDVQRDEFQLGL